MTGFVIWAVLSTAAAALLVAWPLLRARHGTAPAERRTGAVASLLLILTASLLYPLWSHYPWGAVPAADNESIAPLLRATVEHPEDSQAWLNLGGAYLKIQQWPLARRSFQHADHLGHGSNAAALSGLGETILFENGGNETPQATELFNRALQLDPHSPQALFYTGIALLNAGDRDFQDEAGPAGVGDYQIAAAAEDEHIAVVETGLGELAQMAEAGQITDMKTLLLLQTLRLRHSALFNA